MLAEWALAPDADGLFDRRVAVVVGHRYADVCVVASTTTRVPECPPGGDAGTVWLDSRCRRSSYLTTRRVYMPRERWLVTVHQRVVAAFAQDHVGARQRAGLHRGN